MPRHLVAACALGLLVLSGCGGEPEKPEAPEPTRATASPTSTTPAVPELPEAAKAKTLTGARAFGRHYVELINDAQLEGATQPLHDASAPGCTDCMRVVKNLERLHKSGAVIQGGKWTVEEIQAGRPKDLPGADPVLFMRIRAAKQHVKEPDKPAVEHPAGVVKYTFTVKWTTSGWKVATWQSV